MFTESLISVNWIWIMSGEGRERGKSRSSQNTPYYYSILTLLVVFSHCPYCCKTPYIRIYLQKTTLVNSQRNKKQSQRKAKFCFSCLSGSSPRQSWSIREGPPWTNWLGNNCSDDVFENTDERKRVFLGCKNPNSWALFRNILGRCCWEIIGKGETCR